MQLYHLETPDITAEVSPLGGRVWSLKDRATRKQWLWHHPRWQDLEVTPGATYDDHWIGGWDDLFPNDAKGVWEGHELPDHGELWSATWEVVGTPTAHEIELRYHCKSLPFELHKKIWVKGPRLHQEYSLHNLAERSWNLLFKLHPAMAIEPGDRYHFPQGGQVEPVDLEFSSLLGSPSPSPWPLAQGRRGAPVDLSKVPPLSPPEQEFLYLRHLKEGRFGIEDTRGNHFEMTYPLKIFPEFWIFADYGKWQGLQRLSQFKKASSP
jgi:hypothetical protein